MKQVVIIPGGFHPYHAGHHSLYNSAKKAFPNADVYVAATNDTKTRPFPFSIKEKLAKLAGVAPGHFVQVKSPFKSEEITSQYNPEEDVLIFVRSEKDRTEQPKPGGKKKDGTPAYFQPWTGKNLQPFSKHAYIAYLPTVEFGPGITSATEIRKAWPTLSDKRKTAMVMSLYPVTQKNPKLAANVVKMLDMGMGGQEGVAEGLNQINEYRDRLLQYVKSLLPTWPEYVLKDWLVPNKGNFSNLPADALKNSVMEKLKGAGLTTNSKWQLVPNMKFTMDMFDPMTKQRLIGRAGGSSDLGMGIPKDKERHATQAALAQQQGGVRKEPVLLIKTAKGYELLEGWHRTIQHFVKYPDGYTGPAYVAVAQGQQGVAEGSLNEASSDEAWELVGQPVPEIRQFVKQMGYGNDEQSIAKITSIIDRVSATQIPAASIPKLKNLANKGNDAQTLKSILQISGRPDAEQQYTKLMQARDAGEGRNRDVSGYIQYVKSGNYDPPVLLKLPTGVYVIGGRTRLYAALALGVPANVKIISANSFKQGVAETQEKFNQAVMQPGFEFSQEINGVTYEVTNDAGHGPVVTVTDKNNEVIAQAAFSKHKTRPGLESINTYVEPAWQGEGIAANMYAVMRMLGANISPSTNQTDDGLAMWAKWNKQGDAKHIKSLNSKIKEQGVAEGAMKDLDIDLQDQQWDAIVGYVVDGLKNNMDIGRMELNLYQYAGQEMFDVDQELENRGFRDLADLAAHIQQNSGRYVPPRDFDLGEDTTKKDLVESLRQEFELLEDEFIGEIKMSPTNLRSEAAQTGARAGMEFEMIVPGARRSDFKDVALDFMNAIGMDSVAVGEYHGSGGYEQWDGSGWTDVRQDDYSDDPEPEPDYDQDESCRSIDDAVEFFNDRDWNDPEKVERLRQRMQEDFGEWLDEKIDEDWANNPEEYIYQYLVADVDAATIGEIIGEDFSDADGPTKQQVAQAAEIVNDNEQQPYYNDARDWHREEYQDGWDESDWLDSQDLDRMSGIENAYDITWPHWNYGDRDEVDPKKPSNIYTVEPDGSLRPNSNDDTGLEFVSPPVPIDQMLDQLKKVRDWAKSYGCYTNNSTGLHINVSVPEFSNDKLDYVKLALLLGDQYVLDQFGRSSNTYTKSALGIVQDRVRKNPNTAQALLDRMREHMKDLATKAIHSGETDKYTSINTKEGYIEFRSPGGDWLDENFDKVENTLLRFTVALKAAMDPEAYREEYLKKLYKLLNPQGLKDEYGDMIEEFSRYMVSLQGGSKEVGGKLSKATQKAIKDFRAVAAQELKQKNLAARLKKGKTGGKQYWWRVYKDGRDARNTAMVEVVASSEQEARDKAAAEFGIFSSEYKAYMDAVALRPYVETEPEYEIFQVAGNRVVQTFRAADNNAALAYFDRTVSAGDRPYYDVRRAGTGTAEPAAQQPAGSWEFELSQTDIENRLGLPDQTGDANYEVFNRNTQRPVFVFIANTDAEASRKYSDWLAASGLPNDEDYGFRERARPGSTLDLQRTRARQTSDQQQGGLVDVATDAGQNANQNRQFTGVWLILDPDGNVIHSFAGVGNAQSDANRVAIQWLRANPGSMQAGITVVPEMI